MKVLLDTNALIWWMEDKPLLGDKARQVLANPSVELLASVVSLWEITIKWRIGKHQLPGSAYDRFLQDEGIEVLGLTGGHLAALEKLGLHHRDPFDHLILAQATAEDAVLMTSDRVMAEYGVRCIVV